jgi:HlyD family secretion protein
MSKKKKITIWISVGAAVVILIGAYFLLRKKPQTEYTTAPVERGDVVQTVSVTGDVVDREEVVLNFEIGGRLASVNIKEGDQVTQGEVVATLNDADLNSQVEAAKAQMDKAVAEGGMSDDTIHEADVAVDNAKKVLGDTKDLNKQNVDAAEQAVKNAQNYLDDAQKFYDENPTKTNKLTLTTAENNLKSAKEAKDTAEQQTNLSETEAQNGVDSADAHLDTTKSDYAQNSRDADVASARANYDLALNNLSRSVLKAPANGIITAVNDKKGDILGTGVIKESFATMISGDLMIEAQIPESDILKIKEGLAADFTLDSLGSDQKFTGRVIEIFPAATVSGDVITYKVKFTIDNLDSRFKDGMTANLDIKTNEKDNVLRIPMRALKTEGDHKYVDVLGNNNQTEKVEVTTGLEGDEGMVEIKSGLKEGDKVVTFAKQPQ